MLNQPENPSSRVKIALEYGRDMDLRVGTRHLSLLCAVLRCGSITAAARSSGLSYRGAWLMLSDLETCVGHGLLIRTRGGRGGGGVSLTAAGLKLIALMAELEDQMLRGLTSLAS